MKPRVVLQGQAKNYVEAKKQHAAMKWDATYHFTQYILSLIPIW